MGRTKNVVVITMKRYPVWIVAKALNQSTQLTRQRFARVGWATQDMPFPYSPWSIPSEILELHFPELKKKIDSLNQAGIRLHKRGSYTRTHSHKTHKKNNEQNNT